jgi:CRP-like cAMP-binding protein
LSAARALIGGGYGLPLAQELFTSLHLGMEVRDQIGVLAWFAGLEPGVRGALEERGRVQRRAAGEWLYGEGDEDTGVVAVLEGGLYLHAQAPDGGEVLITLLPAGGVMGQSIEFGGGPRLVTAISAVDSTLFVLSDRALREIAATHASLWPALSALTYGQLRESLRSVSDFVALKPRARLISRLVQFSAFAPRVPATQAALAEMIGASRNAVNGWLSTLEAEGVIARGYRHIDVIDRRALQRRLSD